MRFVMFASIVALGACDSGSPQLAATKRRTDAGNVTTAPATDADAALLAFARTCAQEAEARGNKNIAIDTARITLVHSFVWVSFHEKAATPNGDYTVDVTDTSRGCVWIPRE